jgi:prepilin peptidase CpaA
VALAAFVIGFGLFALRWLGGGDVKLAAVIFLWTGAPLAWPVLLLISALGLPVAMFSMLAARFVKRRGQSTTQHQDSPQRMRRLANWWSAKRGVPYGVALALGGGTGLWLPVIFHLPRF